MLLLTCQLETSLISYFFIELCKKQAFNTFKYLLPPAGEVFFFAKHIQQTKFPAKSSLPRIDELLMDKFRSYMSKYIHRSIDRQARSYTYACFAG